MPKPKNDKYPRFLFYSFCAIWFLLALTPKDRFNWFLENILIFVAVCVLLVMHRKFHLSNLSYSLIFIYLVMHVVGAHFTYGDVPIDWKALGFDRDRNYYDRVVHFSFGLLLSYPIREMFLRIAKVSSFWSYYLPLDVTLSFSALYEIGEWVAANVINPSQVEAFIGMQGDVFDPVKDMALAGIGSFIAMSVTAIKHARKDNKFFTRIRRSLGMFHLTDVSSVLKK